jgi:hypothetical protein
MKQIVLNSSLGIFLSMHCAVAQSSPNPPFPPDSEIRQILVDRIDKDRQSVGIVVGCGPKGSCLRKLGQG